MQTGLCECAINVKSDILSGLPSLFTSQSREFSLREFCHITCWNS